MKIEKWEEEMSGQRIMHRSCKLGSLERPSEHVSRKIVMFPALLYTLYLREYPERHHLM